MAPLPSHGETENVVDTTLVTPLEVTAIVNVRGQEARPGRCTSECRYEGLSNPGSLFLIPSSGFKQL